MEILTPESTIEDLDNYVEDCLDQRVEEVFVDLKTLNNIGALLVTFPTIQIAFDNGGIALLSYRNILFKQTEKDSGSSFWRGFEFKTIIL